jgi:hypothetical protein
VLLEFKSVTAELLKSSEKSIDGYKLKSLVTIREKEEGIHDYEVMWNFYGG